MERIKKDTSIKRVFVRPENFLSREATLTALVVSRRRKGSVLDPLELAVTLNDARLATSEPSSASVQTS